MNNNWTYKKLGEVCNSDLGKTLNQSKDKGTLRPYLCAINILWDKVDLSILKQTKFEDSELERYSAKKGDLLICEGGDTGRAAIWISDEPILYQNALHRVRLNSECNARFVLYYLWYLKGNGDIDLKYSKGVTIKHLVKSSLLSIPIPIPPLSEQEAIVKELDLIHSIIDKKNEQLRELDKLAQSVFYTMFGDPIINDKNWEVKKLGETVEEMFLGPFGSALKVSSYVDKKDAYCIVYEQKHAIQGSLNVETHYISKDKFLSLERFNVKAGDFIMSCRGTIGRLYQLPKDAPLGIIHPSVMKIRLKKDYFAPTFFHFIITKVVANESTNGNCIQMAITATELGKRTIIYPPLSLQQEFAKKVEAIEAQKELIRKSITEVETLLASRMQHYFG